MKIDNSVKPLGGLSNSESRTRSVKDQPATQANAAGAQVELSSLSSRLKEAEAVLANVPVVDASRVAEIKQAISEGRFEVDAGKVADGLIQAVKQMLSAQSRRA